MASLAAVARPPTAAAARMLVIMRAAGAARRGFMQTAEDGSRVPAFLPPKRGLYDPANEKDSCGVG